MLTQINLEPRAAMAEEFTFANVRCAVAGSPFQVACEDRDGRRTPVPDGQFAITSLKKTGLMRTALLGGRSAMREVAQ